MVHNAVYQYFIYTHSNYFIFSSHSGNIFLFLVLVLDEKFHFGNYCIINLIFVLLMLTLNLIIQKYDKP